MSSPLLGAAEEESQSNVTVQVSTASTCSILKNNSGLKEHNYMGLSDCSSSVDSSAISTASDENRNSLNLKATELTLGLPGSLSPERDSDCDVDEKPLFPLHPLRDANSSNSSTQKFIVAGNKRGFSIAMESKFIAKSDADVVLSPRPASNLALKSGSFKENPAAKPAKMMEVVSSTAVLERSSATNDAKTKHMDITTKSSAPAPKAQVVGWPPIRSFRKNSLATTSKNAGEVDGKAGPGSFFVKVSMDGAPYLRKVDLTAYSAYQELSSALEKMFSCFTIGQCTSGTTGKELSSEIKMKDLLHESEYVLTYEDKDGDWMLVGDVPWEMFIDTCKRLRIMKSSDAIGLAPRAVDKCMSKT